MLQDTGHAEGVPIATPRGRSVEVLLRKGTQTFISPLQQKQWTQMDKQTFIVYR